MNPRAGLRLDLNDMLPTFAALVLALLATAALDGAGVVVVVGIIVIGMLAASAARDRSPAGVERRAARERFHAMLDPAERRMRLVTRVGPVILAGIVAILAGLDARYFACMSIFGFVAAQAFFALWLERRWQSHPVS